MINGVKPLEQLSCLEILSLFFFKLQDCSRTSHHRLIHRHAMRVSGVFRWARPTRSGEQWFRVGSKHTSFQIFKFLLEIINSRLWRASSIFNQQMEASVGLRSGSNTTLQIKSIIHSTAAPVLAESTHKHQNEAKKKKRPVNWVRAHE